MAGNRKRNASFFWPSFLFLCIPHGAPIEAGDAQGIANFSVLTTEGQVEIISANEVEPIPVYSLAHTDAESLSDEQKKEIEEKSPKRMTTQRGEILRTGPNARATILVPFEGLIEVDENTEIRLPETNPEAKEESSVEEGEKNEDSSDLPDLELLKGRLFLSINRKHKEFRNSKEFRLKTPTTILAVKGTRFFASADPVTGTEIAGVLEGEVDAIRELDGQAIRKPIPVENAFVFTPNGVEARPLHPEELEFEIRFETLDEVVQTEGILESTREDDNLLRWSKQREKREETKSYSYERMDGEREVVRVEFSRPTSEFDLEATAIRLQETGIKNRLAMVPLYFVYDPQIGNDRKKRVTGAVQMMIRATGISRVYIDVNHYPSLFADQVIPVSEEWTVISLPFDYGPGRSLSYGEMYLYPFEVLPVDTLREANQKYSLEIVVPFFSYLPGTPAVP